MAVAHEVFQETEGIIKRGKYWVTTHLNAALANAASDGVVISVGSAAEVRFKFQITSSGSALLRLMEAPTVTASAALTAYNANRYRAASGALSISGASLGTSPDFAAAAKGTVIWESFVPAIGAFGGGGTVGDETGRILNRNTKYILGASNAQGATGGIGFRLEWSE